MIDRRPGGLVLLAACVAGVALASWFRFDAFADDAFITLRYVRHLAHGEGYVYNLGERVEGTTNLLWALLLVPFEWLRVDLVQAARGLGILCAGAALALAITEASARGRWIAAVSVFVLGVLQPDLTCWAGGGLETPLVALLGMLVLRQAGTGGWGPWAGLAFLARPDGILSVFAGGRPRGRDIAWVGAIVAVATAFRLVYFHALIPNSAAAKLSFSPEVWLQGGRYLASFLRQGNALLIVAALYGAWRHRTDPLVRGGAAWCVAQIAFTVFVGGDGLAMHRFFVPIVPVLLLLAGLGIAALVESSRLRFVLPPILLVVGLPLLIADGGVRSPATQRDTEIPRWTEAGQWLAAHTPPDALVAAAPIGALGYFSERPILDLLGLTDAHIAHVAPDPKILRPGHRNHDGAYVLDRQPAFLLLGNVDVSPTAQTPRPFEWERDVDADPRLRRDYQVCSARLPDGMFLNYWYRRDRGPCPAPM